MNFIKKNFHLILLYLLIVSLGAFIFLRHSDAPKTAYINTIELYNSFKLKQEFEKRLTASQSARKSVLDSLLLNLKILNGQVQANPKDQELFNHFTMQKQYYLEQEQLLKEDNERQANDYNTKVWNQLNQYVKDYALQNGYDYIYGADGSGSLMYASDAMEITAAMKEYVNQKYEGKTP